MRFASYIRVSTDQQAKHEKFGLDRQRAEITQYLQGLGFSVALEFQDTISGTKATRLGLEKLLASARAGEFSAVVVSEYDRLGREYFLTGALVYEFLGAGLTVHSALDGVLDPRDAHSRQNFALSALGASSELEKIRRRMYAGQLSKVNGGKPLAPMNQYGYKDGEVYEPEAQWVRWLFEHVKHKGIHVLAEELRRLGVKNRGDGFWYFVTVQRILKNPRYKGLYMYGKASCACPAIVSESVWDRAQFAIQSRRRNSGRIGIRTHLFPLQGRIRCALCNGAMSGNNVRKDDAGNFFYGYYYCRRRVSGVVATRCEHREHHNSTKIHAAVRETLEAALLAQIDIASLVRVAPSVPVDLAPQRARLRLELKKLEEAYLVGGYSAQEFTDKKRERVQNLQTLEQKSKQSLEPKPLDVGQARHVLESALKNDDLHLLARDLGLQVTVHRDGSLDLVVMP